MTFPAVALMHFCPPAFLSEANLVTLQHSTARTPAHVQSCPPSLFVRTCCCAAQEGAIASAHLAAALGDRLCQGARLHCFVDTGGCAPFTLPCATFMRKDGWLDWEVRPLHPAMALSSSHARHRRLHSPNRGVSIPWATKQ